MTADGPELPAWGRGHPDARTPIYPQARLGYLVAAESVAATLLVYVLRQQPWLLALCLTPLLVGAVVAAALLTSSIDVSVRAQGLTVAFPPLYRRTIHPADITEVRLRDVQPAQVGGLGLRRRPGPVTALLWAGGPGVEVRERGGARTIVATPDARRLHQALLAMIEDP